jgi:hypothetical protein
MPQAGMTACFESKAVHGPLQFALIPLSLGRMHHFSEDQATFPMVMTARSGMSRDLLGHAQPGRFDSA